MSSILICYIVCNGCMSLSEAQKEIATDWISNWKKAGQPPNFIKQFQTQLLYTLFDCKDSSDVVKKRYGDALLLVTQAIDKIMTGHDLQQQNLVVSKLLRQDIVKYKSLFPHVSAAIQLSNDTGKHPIKGDTIQYVYTNS